MSNFYLDLHAIHAFPFCNINRDDTGTPKGGDFGDTYRSGCSSQSKKATEREYYRSELPEDQIGIRTRKVKNCFADELMKQCPDLSEEEAFTYAYDIMLKSGLIKKDKNKKKDKDASDNSAEKEAEATAEGKEVMFFISKKQITGVVKEYIRQKEEGKFTKSKLVDELNANPTLDMLLYGRMSANNNDLSYEAATSVAPMVSTHEAYPQQDFFTAVDDLDKKGAAHMGTQEFVSFTGYRYESINLRELMEGASKEETIRTVMQAIKAFIFAIPKGKIHSYANYTLPSFVSVSIRRDCPASFVLAFERPVKAAPEGGFIENSKKQLTKYVEELYFDYINPPEKAWEIGDMGETDLFGERVNAKTLMEKVEEYLKEEL